jgi:hypothetical protein
MTYTIKPEYMGTILEICSYKYENKIFDTNTVDPSQYEKYYNEGFDWAFELM